MLPRSQVALGNATFRQLHCHLAAFFTHSAHRRSTASKTWRSQVQLGNEGNEDDREYRGITTAFCPNGATPASRKSRRIPSFRNSLPGAAKGIPSFRNGHLHAARCIPSLRNKLHPRAKGIPSFRKPLPHAARRIPNFRNGPGRAAGCILTFRNTPRCDHAPGPVCGGEWPPEKSLKFSCRAPGDFCKSEPQTRRAGRS